MRKDAAMTWMLSQLNVGFRLEDKTMAPNARLKMAGE